MVKLPGLTFAFRPRSILDRACPLQRSHLARWPSQNPRYSSSDRKDHSNTRTPAEPQSAIGNGSPQPLFDAPSLSDSVRLLMRTHPHSLCAVVSAAAPPSAVSHDTHLSSSPSALLVSSFNAVTLVPRPYVSFNIKVPSATFDAIRTSRAFTVSGLGQKAAAEAFVTSAGRRWDAWKPLVGPNGAVTAEAGGRWWMRCEYRSDMQLSVGDHMVLVAEVVDAGSAAGKGFEKQGMVYLDGEYRLVGGQGL